MGIMLKIGSESNKYFLLEHCLKPEYSRAHKEGYLHFHDLDFQNITINCVQLNLHNLFKGGFSTGHGHLREPNSIRSYGSLACIAIQSSQNDFFGGQSINLFDFYMADGVRKSFKKAFKKNILIAGKTFLRGSDMFINYVDVIEDSKLPKYLDLNSLDLAIQDFIDHNDDDTFSNKILGQCFKFAFDQACIDVEEETHQSMEAVVHNFNTLHCLPDNEQIWVYDTVTNQLILMSMIDIFNNFSNRRFKVLSFNKQNGNIELKYITHIKRQDNYRRLITLQAQSGQKVTVTDNHQVMYLSNTGQILETFPEKLPNVVFPRNFDLKPFITTIDLSPYKGKRSTNYYTGQLRVTMELAKIFGYYVAEGSSSEGVVSFAVCNLEKEQELLQLMTKVLNNNFKVTSDTYIDNQGQKKPRCINFYTGVAFQRMIKDKCGKIAKEKCIPQEIIFNSKDIHRAFLNGYLKCDGSIKDRNIDASTVSPLLQKQLQLIIMADGEMPRLYERNSINNFNQKPYHCYEIGFNSNTSKRLGLEFNFRKLRCEYFNYNFDFLYDVLYRTYSGRKPARDRLRKEEVDNIIDYLKLDLKYIQHIFATPIKSMIASNSNEHYVYDIAVEDNENFFTADNILVHNSRAGSQVPFSSLNLGCDTSPEGRLVTKELLNAVYNGLGRGETSIFPIVVFQMKTGINYNPDDPNYDLFKQAMKCSAKRLFPTYMNEDATYNAQYYNPNNLQTLCATMGCRTRVMGNVNGPEESGSRGNFAFCTINLPMLAIEANHNIGKFFEKFDYYIQLSHDYLLDRFNFIAKKHVYNYPFMMGQKIYMGSEHLRENDTIYEAIKNASISIGFVGLAECLTALIGQHHGESVQAQQLGLMIISHLRAMTDKYTKADHLNWSTFATPAESCAGRLCKLAAKKYGIIKGVTDKEYFTNSSHVPVSYNISAANKIKIEAPYHELCNAGVIFYAEFDGDATKNLEAFETVIRRCHDSNMNYFAINTKSSDYCPACGNASFINDKCPICGYHEHVDNQHYEADFNIEG